MSHVTHYMTSHRKALCSTGSSRRHAIADVRLGSEDWSQVTCKRCLASKERTDRARAKASQRVEKTEPTIEVESPINPVRRDGMVNVSVAFGDRCKVSLESGEIVKEFPLTINTVKRIVKFCDSNNYFPVNIKDGRICF